MNLIDIKNEGRITWGALFPTQFCNRLKKEHRELLSKYLGVESGEGSERDTGEEMQKVIVRMLLKKEYRIREDGKDITDKGKSQFSKYYQLAQGDTDYDIVTTHLLEEFQYGHYHFSSSPFLSELKRRLTDLFALLPSEFVNEYQAEVTSFIDLAFGKRNLLKNYKSDVKTASFPDQMTCLVTIAATWRAWETDSRQAFDLARCLFPLSGTPDHAEDNSNYFLEQIELAEKLFSEARALFDRGEYEKAAKDFQELTSHASADDYIRSDAFYFLALCILDHKNDLNNPKQYPSARKLLKKAIQYGNREAVKRYKQEYKEDLEVIPLICALPETHGESRIILNTRNRYSDAFAASLPTEMTGKKECITFASTREQWESEIDSIQEIDQDCRFLLFDDDFEKNFQDLLSILNHISKLEQNPNSFSRYKSPFFWYRIAIYIRADEQKYAPLIDTALKRSGDFTIRVSILDDHKWPAEHLFYQHPLFTPFQNYSAKRLQNDVNRFSLTIISDGNPDLSCWLVKESFWLGCFLYPNLTLSVHIIGPHADAIEKQLRLECPGIFGTLPDAASVSKFEFDTISVDSIRSVDVIHAVQMCANPINAMNYYIVNVGNSVDNLDFARMLREYTLRKLVRDDTKKFHNRFLPMIAFYCEDRNIAHLSEHIVIQTVESGDQWFNNYHLIPFGMIQNRYSWQCLDGGYLEKVAQSAHLQYCGVPTDAPSKEKLQNLKDYFSRSYNRGSSMAVALCMPYRLFQTQAGKYGHIISTDSNLSPDHKPDDVDDMAQIFAEHLPWNRQPLLLLEHSRWLRWALSRGWEAASAGQVLSYMKAGNPKHQLHIAKLHGCICDLDELKPFAETLCDKMPESCHQSKEQIRRYAVPGLNGTVSPKDFSAIDRLNIENTAKIMKTEWEFF